MLMPVAVIDVVVVPAPGSATGRTPIAAEVDSIPGRRIDANQGGRPTEVEVAPPSQEQVPPGVGQKARSWRCNPRPSPGSRRASARREASRPRGRTPGRGRPATLPVAGARRARAASRRARPAARRRAAGSCPRAPAGRRRLTRAGSRLRTGPPTRARAVPSKMPGTSRPRAEQNTDGTSAQRTLVTRGPLCNHPRPPQSRPLLSWRSGGSHDVGGDTVRNRADRDGVLAGQPGGGGRAVRVQPAACTRWSSAWWRAAVRPCR